MYDGGDSKRLLVTLSGTALTIFIIGLLLTPSGFKLGLLPEDHPPAPDTARVVPQFSDRTLDLGLDFVHRQGEEHLMGLDESLGPGACALDYDNDGWVDLFLVNGSGQTRYYGKPYWWQAHPGNALYRNINGRGFDNQTAKSGLQATMWGIGCTSADFDNDGDADLLVLAADGNRLYRNEGNGTFSDITAGSGLEGDGWSITAAVADFDSDGLQDIYIDHYVNFRKGAHTYEAGSQYAGTQPETFQGELYEPLANHLYRNSGGLRFQDLTKTAGVANKEGRSLGAVWLDANGDRKPDLLVANDRGGASNVLFLNLDGLHFRRAGLDYGLNSTSGHRGIALGDVNADGKLDVAMASMREQLPLLLLHATPPRPLVYVDQARALGIAQDALSGLSGWTPGLQDFNQDGWLDLFMANGLLTPDPDVPRVAQGQPKQLWLNQYGRGFEDVSLGAGIALQDTQSARGAAFADFDNDGDIDIYVAHNNDMGQMLVNEIDSGHHWIGVRATGGPGRRDPTGTVIELKTPSGRQTRVISGGAGFGSVSEQRVVFGLGRDERIESLNVTWSDGQVDRHDEVPIDRYIHLTEGEKPVVDERQAASAAEVPYFADAEPVDRRRYLRLLVKALGIDAALPQLRLAYKAPQARTRLTVLKQVSRHPVQGGLALLAAGLEDEDRTVAIQAVNGICRYEDEQAIRWMLRAFRHPDAEVRQSLAACFGSFFQEEEAVIHRKYLALPYLIRLLGDPVPAVQIEAIRALANAENYRAVDPLLDRLKSTRGDIQAEAARALGLIREGKAIPELVHVLTDGDTAPLVRAQILIALKRLNYPDLGRLLSGLFDGADPFAALGPLQRLETVQAILDDPDDGILFSRSELASRLITAFTRRAEATRDEDESLGWVHLFGALRLPVTIPYLETLARSPVAHVRGLALQALVETDASHMSRHIGQGLADRAASVRLAVLQTLNKRGNALNIPISRLMDSLDDPATQSAAIAVLPLVSDASGQIERLLSRLLSAPALSEPARLSALEAIEHLKGDPHVVVIPQALFDAEQPSIRLAAIKALSRLTPPHHDADRLAMVVEQGLGDPDTDVRWGVARLLARRPDAWARLSTERLVLSVDTPPDVRLELLRTYDPPGPGAVRQLLLDMVANRQDPLRYRALRRLALMKDPTLEPHAWGWLKDTTEPLKVRIKAARMLARHHGAKIVDILQSMETH